MEKTPLSRVTVYQSFAFIAIIALTCLDDLIALPSLFFGDSPSATNFRDSGLKMSLILIVWFIVACSTRKILARVRYLEGFMRVCAWCHHIDFKSKWVSMEDFLQQGFDTPTTHGICPICLATQKAAHQKAKQARLAAAAAEAGSKPAVG